MKLKFHVFFFLCLLTSFAGKAQIYKDCKGVINVNFQQGYRPMGEVSAGLCLYEPGNFFGPASGELNTLNQVQLGAEFNFSNKHFVMGPKLTYNFSYFIVNCGASLSYLTDLKYGTVYLNPHFGITFNTYADLYIGYNIPLMKNYMKPYVNHFTVTLAVPILNR
ncbi:MAG: hypothetical protein IAF38_18770 [Bacteroidia bacterium]|nr:hypothetical protein [Bacteroidia bacterium]